MKISYTNWIKFTAIMAVFNALWLMLLVYLTTK